MNTKEIHIRCRKNSKGSVLMNNLHDSESSNKSRHYIPVASIGSTTNTLDPSANLSGSLKITHGMRVYNKSRSSIQQNKPKAIETMVPFTDPQHQPAILEVKREKEKAKRRKKHFFQAWISYLFKYIVGWRVSSFLLIPFPKRQKEKQNYYSILKNRPKTYSSFVDVSLENMTST